MQPRKTRKSFDEPGHAHLLTFTCYKHRPFFADDATCRLFLEILDAARNRHGFEVWAYVIMPEHVHLLVFSGRSGATVATILQSVKQPIAAKLKQSLPPNLPNGKFRMWERGGGHDRNLWSDQALHKAMEYVHANPVRRDLSSTPEAYEWSSARWYEKSEGPFSVDNIAEVKL